MEQKGTTIKMCRLYSTSHDKRSIPTTARKYWVLDSKNQLSTQSEKIAKCQLVITTISTAFHIPTHKFKFTHILIDEAAQVLETEAVIPLALASLGTCVVMAGDHRQMGPTVSKFYVKKAMIYEFEPLRQLSRIRLNNISNISDTGCWWIRITAIIRKKDSLL